MRLHSANFLIEELFCPLHKSFCTLHQIFTPVKASQNLAEGANCVVQGYKPDYEIDPWSKQTTKQLNLSSLVSSHLETIDLGCRKKSAVQKKNPVKEKS